MSCGLLCEQVQNEDPTHERLQLFNKLWTIHFAHDSLLVFSTGRSPNLFCNLWVSNTAVLAVAPMLLLTRRCHLYDVV
jgi:hypothetical protein